MALIQPWGVEAEKNRASFWNMRLAAEGLPTPAEKRWSVWHPICASFFATKAPSKAVLSSQVRWGEASNYSGRWQQAYFFISPCEMSANLRDPVESQGSPIEVDICHLGLASLWWMTVARLFCVNCSLSEVTNGMKRKGENVAECQRWLGCCWSNCF